MEKNQSDYKFCGSLWKKATKTGETFLTGVIEVENFEYPITIFSNKKEHDRQPDFKIKVDVNNVRVKEPFQKGENA